MVVGGICKCCFLSKDQSRYAGSILCLMRGMVCRSSNQSQGTEVFSRVVGGCDYSIICFVVVRLVVGVRGIQYIQLATGLIMDCLCVF